MDINSKLPIPDEISLEMEGKAEEIARLAPHRVHFETIVISEPEIITNLQYAQRVWNEMVTRPDTDRIDHLLVIAGLMQIAQEADDNPSDQVMESAFRGCRAAIRGTVGPTIFGDVPQEDIATNDLAPAPAGNNPNQNTK